MSGHWNSERIFALNFRLYGLTGFWKIDSKIRWKLYLYRVYHYVVHLYILLNTISYWLDLYLVRDDVELVSRNLCTTIVTTVTIFKNWVLLHRMSQVDGIKQNLANNLNLSFVGQSHGDRQVLDKAAQQLKQITQTLFLLTSLAACFWIMFPLLDHSSQDRSLPLPFPQVMDLQQTPTFEILFVHEVITLSIFLFNILSYDLIYYGFLIQVCAQFDILAKNIYKVKRLYPETDFEPLVDGYIELKKDEGEWEEKKKEMRKTLNRMSDHARTEATVGMVEKNVLHHQAILRQIEDIDDFYSTPFMLQLIAGALLIGVVAFDIILQSRGWSLQLFQRLLYVMAVLFDMFLFCYFGSQMTEKSDQICQVMYDNPWYDMGVRPRKLFLFILARGQKAPKVTGGKVVPVTLATYLKLLRVSYNMIAIMRQAR